MKMFENRTKLCKIQSRKRQLHEMFEKNTEILEVLLLAGLLLSVENSLCHPWPLNSPDIRIDARRLVSDLLNPCSGRSPGHNVGWQPRDHFWWPPVHVASAYALYEDGRWPNWFLFQKNFANVFLKKNSYQLQFLLKIPCNGEMSW